MAELAQFCCELMELMREYEISLDQLDEVVKVVHKQEETAVASFRELEEMFGED